MRSVRLDTISLIALQRADAENDEGIGTTELTGLVNSAIAALWDEILPAGPMHYLENISATVTTTAGKLTYSLTSDFSITNFYKLRRVQVQEQNGHWRSLLPMDLDEAIVLVAPSGGAARIIYLPTAPVLVNPSDTFDGVNGWVELVALWVALRLISKKGLDNSRVAQLYAMELDRVRRLGPRDHGTAGRIQRTSLRRGMWPWATSNLSHYRLYGDNIEIYRTDPMWSSP